MANLKLSICVATYNRGKFIGETLDSILPQLTQDVELIVVDGASPDNTPEVMSQYLNSHPEIRYYREPENSGVDKDYDKAVGYARGQYCWLMTDDDLMSPDAIHRVMSKLGEGADIIVVNSTIKTADFSITLEKSMLSFAEDRTFDTRNREEFFRNTAQGLSFIGCAIVRRDFWNSRNREKYYGTLFVHVGVIFQPPGIEKAVVIAEPLVTIRYGNAMWTPQGFEIWMFKWPELVWSFPDYPDEAKASVYPREPWRKTRLLALYRALGGYSHAQYSSHISRRTSGLCRMASLLIALMPAALINSAISLHCMLRNREARTGMYSLARSPHATFITRIAARSLGVLA